MLEADCKGVDTLPVFSEALGFSVRIWSIVLGGYPGTVDILLRIPRLDDTWEGWGSDSGGFDAFVGSG